MRGKGRRERSPASFFKSLLRAGDCLESTNVYEGGTERHGMSVALKRKRMYFKENYGNFYIVVYNMSMREYTVAQCMGCGMEKREDIWQKERG